MFSFAPRLRGQGMAVASSRMAASMNVAAMPLLTKCSAQMRQAFGWRLASQFTHEVTSSSAAVLFRLMPLISRERLPIGATETSCAWPSAGVGASRLAKRTPRLAPLPIPFRPRGEPVDPCLYSWHRVTPEVRQSLTGLFRYFP